MKKTAATLFAVAVAVFVACTSPTSPVPPEQEIASVAQTPQATTPQPVQPVQTVQAGWEGAVTANGGYWVTNRTSTAQGYTAYYTNFDDQKKVLGSQYGVVQPGDTFSGSFATTCIQVDVGQDGAGGTPLFFGYILKSGAVVNKISESDAAACHPRPTPTPTPTPSPTPTPCIDTVSYSGVYTIKDLSHSGVYYVRSGGITWLSGLSLTKYTTYNYPLAPDGREYCTWHGGERIGCATASKGACTEKFKASWTGKVAYACVAQHSCQK